jgi:hypothetical protein
MERSVAVKKLAKMIGKGFGYQIDGKAPTPEEREAAKAQRPAAIEERDLLAKKRRARYEAVLAADTEYQSLVAQHETARKSVDKLNIEHRRKISVGTTMNLGGFSVFNVKASGDSWEEIFEKLNKKA